MAFIKGWKLTLVLLVAIPFMIVVGATLSVLISKATSKGQEAYAQAGAVVEQAISAIRTVRTASFTFFAQPTFPVIIYKSKPTYRNKISDTSRHIS